MDKTPRISTVIDTRDSKHPIRPSDVPLRSTNQTELRTFGLSEIELAAGRLVSFMRDRGDEWRTFTIGQLRYYYGRQGWKADMMFYGLTGDYLHERAVGWSWREPQAPFVVLFNSGKYCVTDVFIYWCISQKAQQAA